MSKHFFFSKPILILLLKRIAIAHSNNKGSFRLIKKAGVGIYIFVALCFYLVATAVPCTATDSSADTVRLLQPSVATMDRYINDADYNYHPDVNTKKSAFQIWSDRVMQKILSFFKKLFKHLDVNVSSGVWRWLGYIICFLMLSYILLKLMGFDFRKFLVGNYTAGDEIAYAISEENIHELNIEELYRKAVDDKNYRLAVRYRFLSILKTLDSNKQIKWRPDKANSYYVPELHVSLRNTYAVIARQFDFIWYGDFRITHETFDLIKGQMQKFENSITIRQDRETNIAS